MGREPCLRFCTEVRPRERGPDRQKDVGSPVDRLVDTVARMQVDLEGDALNVALLVPLPRRFSRTGLVGGLSAHYGSPGRLADYRRQFEKTTRTAGEDPSIFATVLETLALKAFGDMGQIARLRLICDRFIAGHSSCELRRHLDSVPPETPIWDVVDRCRVWESQADPAVRRLVNLVRIRFIRPMWWGTRTVSVRRSPGRGWVRIS